MEDKKQSYSKRVGKNVGSFLNRVNRGVNEDTEARRKEREQLNALIVDAGMTYATRGTNKIGAASAPKKAKGGKVAYDYIPQGDIKELKAIVRGEHKTYKTKDILDGAYVKATGTKVAAMNTASADKVLELILAYGRFHEEDKKEFKIVAKYIKLSDIKYFQKYLTNDMIVAFYCGVRASFDFKGDYEMSALSGLFRLGEDYIQDFIDKGKEACKDKEFELGLKYPDYDFERLLGKPKQTKIIKGKKNPNFYQYTYKIWIWDSCVAGKAVGYQRFKNGKKDGDYTDMTYGKGTASVELKMGYLGFVSSDSKMLDVLLIYMQNDANGYVKDVEAIYNGLGGVPPEALKAAKVKFAKGGEIYKKGDTVLLKDGNTQRTATVVADGIDSKKRVRVRPQGFPMDLSISTIENDRVYIIKKMAKGGEMNDDKWIQSTVKEMEKKGTVGLFTKKAKRREMTPKQFMKEVLTHPEDYDLKTRREAQWMANVTGDKYEWGGKVDTGVGVSDTLNKAYEYAKGGIIDVFQKSSDGFVYKKTMPQGDGRAFDRAKQVMDEYIKYDEFDRIEVDGKKVSPKEFESMRDKFHNQSFAKGGEISDKDIGETVKIISQDNVVGDLIGIDGNTAYVDFSDYNRPESGEKRDYFDISEIKVVKYDWDKDEYYAKGGEVLKAEKNLREAKKSKISSEIDKASRELDEAYKKEGFAKGGTMKKQGYNDKLDESLSMRKGKASTKKQSDKDRRDESKGMEKSMGKRAYASVGTMDKMAKGGKLKSIMTKKEIGIVIPKTYKIGDKEFGNTYKIERVNTKKYSDNDKNRHYNFRIWEYDKNIDLFDEIKSPSEKLKALERIEMTKDYAKGGQLDSISATKKHYGISTAKWNKMSAKDKEDLRKKSKQDLEAGRKYRQGYNDKLDESLGNTDGKESTKKQSLKDRRDESKGEEKALGKRAYSSVSTMDKLLPFLSWHKK